MMRSKLLALTLLACAALLADAAAELLPPDVSATGRADELIRFQITAFEEGTAGRKVISDAAVEGPPGTDFNVNLEDGRFKLTARFLTDLADGGGLTLRAKLDTKRLYGYSEAGLPLYEEDAQRRALGLSFDESVVLLPFGGGAGGSRLSIEIKPERLGRAPSAGAEAPRITISKPSPGGAISVEATKVPHDFTVSAALFEDGREVARGAAHSLLEEPGELLLRPVESAGEENGAAPLGLKLTVERFEPGTGDGLAAVRFDQLGGDSGRAMLARNWAGVANLGSELTYDLSQTYPGAPGKRYELRLRIDLAASNTVGR
jgi:hypothetical protein